MDEVFAFYNFHEERQACYSLRKYGAEATLRALKLLVVEAANEINKNYVDVADCCSEAVDYDYKSCAQNLIIEWAAYYKKQIVRERLERWVLIVLCLLLFFFWLQQL
nr:hypothetical protein [uncultured Pseudodesulfovibrio sp.]